MYICILYIYIYICIYIWNVWPEGFQTKSFNDFRLRLRISDKNFTGRFLLAMCYVAR